MPGYSPEQQVPGLGAESAAAAIPSAFPFASPSAAPEPWWQRSRTPLISGIVVVLVLLGVLALLIQHVTAPHQAKITLPGTLLGLSRITGIEVQANQRAIVKRAEASPGHLSNVAAGLYGDPAASWFEVVGGACGSCAVGSASQIVGQARSHGLVDARSFPPGPKGGVLICLTTAPLSPAQISCLWFDSGTAGVVEYVGGAASSIADAAAKTVQIRAAVEQ